MHAFLLPISSPLLVALDRTCLLLRRGTGEAAKDAEENEATVGDDVEAICGSIHFLISYDR